MDFYKDVLLFHRKFLSILGHTLENNLEEVPLQGNHVTCLPQLIFEALVLPMKVLEGIFEHSVSVVL